MVARPPSAGHDFLAGGGEMGARMRAFDWSATPLRSAAEWPQSLRTAVSIILNSRHPMFLAWGPDLIFLYNDGYIPICGGKHPQTLGRRFAEIWSEIWDDVFPLIELALAGEATWHEDFHLIMQRNGFPEEAWFTFSYSPIRDETGGVGGMFCACTETTDRVLAERRLALLVELGDRLRDLSVSRGVAAAAAEALGRHLGVAAAGYGEVEDDQEHIRIGHDWTDGTMDSLAGRHRLNRFGASITAELKSGRTLRIDDVSTDPRIAARDEDVFAAIGARSVLAVPLLKAGQLAVIFFLHNPGPRRWTEAEISLVEEVAERTWSAVERARAEERRAVLINELNHRVKNTLATVQSVAWETFRNVAMPDAQLAFESRLLALSRTQDVLTRENWEGAGLAEIVAQSVAPFGRTPDGRLRMAGPDVRLSPRMALALAMALQELATNAVKHGSLSNGTGEIRIDWNCDPAAASPRLRLRWEEAGGPAVTAPQQRGFGSRLLERSLTLDLGAKVELAFLPTGLVCTVDAPLPDDTPFRLP